MVSVSPDVDREGATGKSFRCRVCAVFLFEPDGDHIVCERVYFDSATILRQLGLIPDLTATA